MSEILSLQTTEIKTLVDSLLLSETFSQWHEIKKQFSCIFDTDVIESLDRIFKAESQTTLEHVRVDPLGKNSLNTQALRGLKDIPDHERKARSFLLNAHKMAYQNAIACVKRQILTQEQDKRLQEEWVDVTLPSRQYHEKGKLHVIGHVIDECIAIFARMGFNTVEGNDIEDEYHNFTALNFVDDHPARSMHDSFYLADDDGKTVTRDEQMVLLRTHTSPMQIRSMLAQPPPLRLVIPGRTFRRDLDATHTPMFHQVEGVMIDNNTHLGHLKGCLIDFCRAFFELDDPPMRFRGSFFPFTEPSLEVDILCERRHDKIIVGKGDDWVEILGCGMVHPHVLKNVNLDPLAYQGFAFGMGVERLAMLKYGIPDLRPFFSSQLHWLRHFGFPAQCSPSLDYGLTPTL